MFLTVVASILLAGTALVCATWNFFVRPSASRLWYLVPFILTAMFVATTVIGRLHSGLWLRIAYRISAIWFGFLSFAFLAAIASWFVNAPLAILHSSIEPKTSTTALFGLAVLASLYGLVNAQWVRVSRVTVKLDNLPEKWRGRTVALVTDMHLGNVRGAGFTRQIVAKLEQLRPYAVFISGDLFDGSNADLLALVKPFENLRVPAGTFYVTGNHEEFSLPALNTSTLWQAPASVYIK